MIVGIDGNEANEETKAGVHQMAFEILWGLFKLEDIKSRGHKYIIYLKKEPNKNMPPAKDFWEYKIIPGDRLWILTKLTPELMIHPIANIFFTPSHYLPPVAPLPKVCTITDLGYLKFSGQFRKYDYWQLRLWTAISVIISKYIIVISDSTKKDIVRRYPFANNKTLVVYLAPDVINYNSQIDKNFVRQTLDNYRITKKYIVFMSTLKPSKNIEGLLEAFKMVNKRHLYQLVIVGKKGWLFESIFNKVKELSLEEDVVFTDWISDKERAAVLSGAMVFVLPSFWEGFGIDVLNSFSCGVPVTLSNVASLPEVAGDAGIYFDPKNIVSISNAIKKVLSLNRGEYNVLVDKGYDQVKKFSWDKTAKGVLDTLEKAIK